MSKYPLNCNTEQEANEYGVYAYTVAQLRETPLGTCVEAVGNNSLHDSRVIDFIEKYFEQPVYLAFAYEGEQWDPEQDEVKSVYTMYVQVKKDVKITKDELTDINSVVLDPTDESYDYLSNNRECLEEHLVTYLTYKHVEDKEEFLGRCLEWLVYAADGGLAYQGGGDWIHLDSE